MARSLSLVKAAVTEPFLAQSPLGLVKTERLAEDCGLPPLIVSEPTGVVPLAAIERFMVELGARANHQTFFFETIRSGAQSNDESVANIQLPQNVTGAEAIAALAKRISSFLFGAGFLCEHDGRRLWLLRTAGNTDWTNSWPVQQYNLAVALQAVQILLSRPVRPSAIRLDRKIEDNQLPDVFRDLPIDLSHQTMGLAFDLGELIDYSGGVLLGSSGRPDSHSDRSEGVTAADISACIVSLIRSTGTDCLSQRAAKAFGMSERTYRRRLAILGVTHKSVVSQARLMLGEKLLLDSNRSIADISFELGYSNPPAFTRFFFNRVGVTPSNYRRHATRNAHPESSHF